MPESNRKKVLIVDDEPDILDYFTVLLDGSGYGVISAGSAREAMELLEAGAPDLVCLDVMMPRMSGVALYRTMKDNPELKDVPVMFISAFGGQKKMDAEQFRELAGEPAVPDPDYFLDKPVKPADFLSALEKLIGPGEAE